ncbi:type I-MYXAN CRISPR-associated endonuclease Cas4/Cas1 [Thalassoroseus pseudoceratinae]|uniref:type I-MYXAN CRISPR-associated endonuclease Cas4/Cas1 n=1 Tax=Thalassoroseus pseudoceratinae TaxID=2713176 RepID=UPI0019817D40|nr:type I-MYXAN CRISPR-associated endonuclease Cas1 [Thalassoroseus pseudoceratinae]
MSNRPRSEPNSSITMPQASSAVEPPEDEPLVRVMALHALSYCERLFYLEEVEEIRVADAPVYAGRRLHDDLLPDDEQASERRSWELSSTRWGIFGKVDAARRRDGPWVVYEHKRGRCRRGPNKEPRAWPSDQLQAVAYAVLLEEELGQPVPEARVRYHRDNVTARVAVDEAAREELRQAIQRARELRAQTTRPPVHENERVCTGCSLKVVCLPEEERLEERPHSPTFFPANREGQTLHVVSPKAQVSRSGETLVVRQDDSQRQTVPIRLVDSVVVHGHAQVTTQAIHLCAHHGIGVHWLTAGGRFKASTMNSFGRVQQRLRQYEALSDETTCINLARQLVHAKVESQLRYILRGTRGNESARSAVQTDIERIREAMRKLDSAQSPDTLLGLEGLAAKSYFAGLPQLLSASVPSELHFSGRTKRPPRDRFNCLLGFGYGLLQSAVTRAILAVGLEPSLGFYHRPRSAAHPLVLDLMELFRVPLWDMPLVGSLNRGQWQIEDDFELRPGHVWLSDTGRKKALTLFEQRLEESAKHPHTGQALTYARMLELEVRLLEKEWTGCPGHFAKFRLR